MVALPFLQALQLPPAILLQKVLDDSFGPPLLRLPLGRDGHPHSHPNLRNRPVLHHLALRVQMSQLGPSRPRNYSPSFLHNRTHPVP